MHVRCQNASGGVGWFCPAARGSLSPRAGRGWGEGASTRAWRRRNEDKLSAATAKKFDRRRTKALALLSLLVARRIQIRASRAAPTSTLPRLRGREGRGPVDFVCRERRLVIEVDGGQHAVTNATPSANNGSPRGAPRHNAVTARGELSLPRAAARWDR
jgi:very-short-patch-repair endonuclease